MTAIKKQTEPPFTTIHYEPTPGTVELRRLYTVEKTDYGTFLLFMENDSVVEIVPADPEQPNTNKSDPGSLFDFPETLKTENIYQLRGLTYRSFKRNYRRSCKCELMAQKIPEDIADNLSDEFAAEAYPKDFPESFQQLLENDSGLCELWDKDKTTWIVRRLTPRAYTPAEKERTQGDQKTKAKRTRRKVNRKGGRKTQDGERTKQAARDALAAMRDNPHLSLSRACEFQVKEHHLTISGRGLEKHARAIRRAKT